MSTQKSVCILEDGAETVYCWHEHCATASTQQMKLPTAITSFRHQARPSLSSIQMPPETTLPEVVSTPAIEPDASKAMGRSLESSGRASCVSSVTPSSPAGTPYSEISGLDPIKQTITHSTETLSLSIFDEPNVQDDIEHLRWQEFSPPKELNLVEDGIAPEIVKILKQSVMDQWQAARASEDGRASHATGLSRSDTSGGQSIRSPMLVNEEVLGEGQPGLQVVMESNPIELQTRPSYEGNPASSHKPRFTSLLSISSLSKSSHASGRTSRPGSIRSTASKTYSETVVPVGPMGKKSLSSLARC
jgi:hypothetical protein